MNKLFVHWQTSNLGILMIAGALIHIIFACIHGTATEGVWTATIAAIGTGLGQLASADANKTTTPDQLEDLARKTATAIQTSDTSMLVKPDTTTIDLNKPK